MGQRYLCLLLVFLAGILNLSLVLLYCGLFESCNLRSPAHQHMVIPERTFAFSKDNEVLSNYSVCLDANENSVFSLKCYRGVVEKVQYVRYGHKRSCINDAPEQCDDSNMASHTRFVEEQCLGKRECTFEVNNAKFGEPCYGKTKFLTVRILGCVTDPEPGVGISQGAFNFDYGKKNKTEVPPRPSALALPPIPWKRPSTNIVGPWAETHPCGINRREGVWSEPFIPNPKKSAIIVEHDVNNIPRLVFNILNLDASLPDDWKIQVMYPQNAREIVEIWLADWIAWGRVELLVPVRQPFQVTDYTSLFKTIEFWESLYGDWILVTQVDAILCSKFSKFTVEDFMCYDMIGAPWLDAWINVGRGTNYMGGNGGLSLRRKSAMIRAIEDKAKVNSNMAEDGFFHDIITTLGGTLPHVSVGHLFAVEGRFEGIQPLGVHKAWPFIPAEFLQEFCDTMCPEMLGVHTKKSVKLNGTLPYVTWI